MSHVHVKNVISLRVYMNVIYSSIDIMFGWLLHIIITTQRFQLQVLWQAAMSCYGVASCMTGWCGLWM